MSYDKKVDSTQLNADLTSVANAIRTKGGTSALLSFPSGMTSAIAAIPTGTTPTGTINITTNGTHNVTQYASANVNVPSGGGGGFNVKIANNATIDFDGNVTCTFTCYNLDEEETEVIYNSSNTPTTGETIAENVVAIRCVYSDGAYDSVFIETNNNMCFNENEMFFMSSSFDSDVLYFLNDNIEIPTFEAHRDEENDEE